MCKTTGKTIELNKAKGMSKGKHGFEDYAGMFGPDAKPLTCIQEQFRMGMSDYCRDGGIRPITLTHVTKEAHAQYTKGRVGEDGKITPFEI